MERRFKQRDLDEVPRSLSGLDLTDDDDDSRVLISSTNRWKAASGQVDGRRRMWATCLALSLIGAVLFVARGLRNEVCSCVRWCASCIFSCDHFACCRPQWSDINVLHVVTWNIAAINNNPFE